MANEPTTDKSPLDSGFSIMIGGHPVDEFVHLVTMGALAVVFVRGSWRLDPDHNWEQHADELKFYYLKGIRLSDGGFRFRNWMYCPMYQRSDLFLMATLADVAHEWCKTNTVSVPVDGRMVSRYTEQALFNIGSVTELP